MYKLPHFTEKDTDKVTAFMKDNSFAVITGFGEQYPVATHIPLEIVVADDGKISFSGHLMKNTDHHKAFVKNENVLVIFNGPHTYVSASWYTTPEVASTWNYMTVHAKGKIVFTDDEDTYNIIKSITNRYEGTETAASFDNLSKEYVQQMLKAIAGFTIEVDSLDDVFKLSQNRDKQSKHTIAAHLKAKGGEHAAGIATEMEKRSSV